MFVIDHPVALADRDLKIALQSLPPSTDVTITANQRFPSGSCWQAAAVFVSDDKGGVDLTRDAPRSGSYAGVQPMGLIWSAERVAVPGGPPPPGAQTLPREVQLDARWADSGHAEAVLQRQIVGPGVTRREVAEDGVVGTLFLPPGQGPHPTVVALNGGGGGLNEYWAAMLASHGYASLALGVFNVPGRPRALIELPLDDLESAIRWLRGQAWLRDHLLAVWGPSRGGELALLLGATYPEIDAVIAWSPSGVVFWGLGQADDGRPGPHAAWSRGGEPLPYLQEDNRFADRRPDPAPAGEPIAWAPAYLAHLEDSAALARATIPVERIRGPVLLVSGSDDRMWPSQALAEVALRRLEAHRHPHPYRHLAYPGAGHNILVPHSPLTVRASGVPIPGVGGQLFSLGGTPQADAAAGAAAWRETLAFLEQCVGGVG